MSDSDNTDMPAAIDCKDVLRRLYEYIDGELDNMTHAQIEHHLGHCRSCLSRADFESELKTRIKSASQEKVPEQVNERLQNVLDKF